MSNNLYYISIPPPRPSAAHKPFREYTRDGEHILTHWIDTRAVIGRSEKRGIYHVTFTEEATHPLLAKFVAEPEQEDTPLFPIVIKHFKQEHEALLYAYGVNGKINLQYIHPADTKYPRPHEEPDPRVTRMCAKVVQDALRK